MKVVVFFMVSRVFFSFMVRTRSSREAWNGGTNVGGNVPSSAETPASGPGDTVSSERTRAGGDANLDRSGGGNVSGEATGGLVAGFSYGADAEGGTAARQQQVDLLTRHVEPSLPSSGGSGDRDAKNGQI